jgi:hypothetical protein
MTMCAADAIAPPTTPMVAPVRPATTDPTPAFAAVAVRAQPPGVFVPVTGAVRLMKAAEAGRGVNAPHPITIVTTRRSARRITSVRYLSPAWNSSRLAGIRRELPDRYAQGADGRGQRKCREASERSK